jgi:thiamine biosynthesis lipoprotein
LKPAHIYKKGDAENLFYCWFSAMHTRVDILFQGAGSENSYSNIAEEIKQRIDDIELIGNCFNPQSELSRYNRGRLKQSSLSQELRHILELCNYWKQKTDGLFDVAYEGKINLSGFLKGYTLDAIRPILTKHNIHSALINMGNSSILGIGRQSPDCDGWKVKNISGEAYLLRNQCLTTSGNDSPDRMHIFNPATGSYVEGKRSVSVVTTGGAEGEVMATVSFIMGA